MPWPPGAAVLRMVEGKGGRGFGGGTPPSTLFSKRGTDRHEDGLCFTPTPRVIRAVPLPPSRGVTAGDTPDPEDSYPRASGQVSFQISKVSTGGDASIQLEGTT